MKTTNNNSMTLEAAITKMPKVLIYGKLGTFKKIEIVIEAVTEVKKRYGLIIDVVVAGSDSHLAQGYLQKIKEEYSSFEGLSFNETITKRQLAELMTHNIVVNYPYTTGGQGNLFHVDKAIHTTLIHKLNNFRVFATQQDFRSESFCSTCENSLAEAIYELIIRQDQQIA